MCPRTARVARRVVAFVAVFMLGGGVARAQSYRVLHTFVLGDVNDGAQPFAGLIQGTDGNFYGTSGNGGTNNVGTVFKMDAAGMITVLHSFAISDGMFPKASLAQGTDGFLYGTTSARGTLPGGGPGAGTVFKIATDGSSFANLHTFGGPDGAGPVAALIQGTDGAFYGTTAVGGTAGGTVFRITSTGTLTSLHSFTGPDGRTPVAPLIQATDGAFYGTTAEGGTAPFNTATQGTIFKITSSGSFTSLHTFTFPSNLNDGANPRAPLLQAADGNFYGTTETGGSGHSGFGGDGTVFRMDPAGNVTMLHHFQRTDGRNPLGGLVQAPNGQFYGTTSQGDNTSNTGTVFRMNAAGAVTTLHNFLLSTEYSPLAGVIRGVDGSLYGTTQLGGTGTPGLALGVVFRLNLMASLAVNFGPPYGAWTLTGSAWGPLHGLSPVAMVSADLDGSGIDDLVINFGSGVGVYAWLNHATWTFLHPSSPSRMVTGDLDNNGHDDLVVVFPGYGTWRWSDGSWTNLHGRDAARLAVGNLDSVANTDLILDFPGYGLWVFANGSSWTQLHALDAATIVTADLDGNGRDDVVVDFPGYGLWVRYSSGTWTPLHGLSASHIAAGHLNDNAQADLVIDFGAGVGIWTLRDNATWVKLHGLTSQDLLVADRDGTGKDEILIDFGPPYGLWQYANDSAWSQLHSLSPVGLAAGRFY